MQNCIVTNHEYLKQASVSEALRLITKRHSYVNNHRDNLFITTNGRKPLLLKIPSSYYGNMKDSVQFDRSTFDSTDVKS